MSSAEPSSTRRMAMRLLLESPLGVDVELPRGGTSLEIPQVYDAVARDLLKTAREGRIAIVQTVPAPVSAGELVQRLVFRRLA